MLHYDSLPENFELYIDLLDPPTEEELFGSDSEIPGDEYDETN
jgi:hypothetical protein